MLGRIVAPRHAAALRVQLNRAVIANDVVKPPAVNGSAVRRNSSGILREIRSSRRVAGHECRSAYAAPDGDHDVSRLDPGTRRIDFRFPSWSDRDVPGQARRV